MGKTPRDERRKAHEAAEQIAKTVKLALGALDHARMSDEELERLCDEALCNGVSRPDQALEPLSTQSPDEA